MQHRRRASVSNWTTLELLVIVTVSAVFSEISSNVFFLDLAEFFFLGFFFLVLCLVVLGVIVVVVVVVVLAMKEADDDEQETLLNEAVSSLIRTVRSDFIVCVFVLFCFVLFFVFVNKGILQSE